MSVFPDWRKYAVHQRRPKTGCIPTGFEILIRASSISGIDLATFQDDFDLEHVGVAKNNFQSVANAIKQRYPSIQISITNFPQGQGKNKLVLVESQLIQKRPILVSLTLAPQGGWHIMPVLDADENNLTLLEQVDEDGNPKFKVISKQEFVRIHDEWPGGGDIAYLS